MRPVQLLALGMLIAASFAAPSTADAQFGALKRRIEDKVVDKVMGPSASSGAARSAEVLEITPEVLQRLEQGLAAEDAARTGGSTGEQAEEAGARAGGFRIDRTSHWGKPMVSREYGILKERVVPFCGSPAARVGNYAYSAAEQAALRPRCEALSPALDRVM